ncbi:ABC transporter substrate-binding protein [Pseudonocardia xishanensis]|uniref:ABC transporter substrate-binding protein n=1 Tax=Pseudonocardia xishanensis TaxID=630995 RepID=UPI0031E4FF88
MIQAEPKRVVTVGSTDHDTVLALGVTPVAVSAWRGAAFHPWNESSVGATRPVELSDQSTAINIEEVVAQKPDLIIAIWSSITQAEYDQLSKIAPVVAPDSAYPVFGAPWQATTRTVGKALGKSAEAEKVITDTEGEIAAAKAANPALVGKKVLIAADFGAGEAYPTPPTDVRYGVLTGLGMDSSVPGLADVSTLSFEESGKLNAADVLVWITIPGATVEQNPVYLAQPVHLQGRDVFTNADQGLALTYSTVLSIPYTLKNLVPKLTSAADGDPATAVAAA